MAMYSSHLLYRWLAGAAGLTMSAFIRTQAFTKSSRSVGVRNLAFFLTPKSDLLQSDNEGAETPLDSKRTCLIIFWSNYHSVATP
jgi:hypothetical protein